VSAVSAASGSKRNSPNLEVRLLGQFEVLRDGQPVPEEAWGRRKSKTLLKILLTQPGRVFTQDQLIDALFDSNYVNKARENLYGRISQLRHALEPALKHGTDSGFVLRQGQGYSFSAGSNVWIDVLDFERGLTDAQKRADKKDWTDAAGRFEDALGLYRGEFLPEDRYEDWAEDTRSRLQNLYLDALTQLADCYEQLGRIRQAMTCCQRVLHVEPYREAIIRQLMRYQHQTGHQAQALATYREGERALRENLDVEPSAETRALRDEITTQRAEEPRLDPRRIAVLPLENFSPDLEDEYFASGMTEELIGSLSKIKDLRVVARTSVLRYRGTTKPISQIARELSVGTILEGSARKAGNKVRISVQLIDAATEDHLWAQRYELSLGDVLQVQGEIARRASAALQLELLKEEDEALRSVQHSNSASHVAYLKGRHFLRKSTREAIRKAIRCFEEALHSDPRFARALTGIADAYCRLAVFTSADESYPEARAYAEQALAIDDSLSEVYTSLAVIAADYENDLSKAERLLRQAIQLDPNYALAYAHLADLLAIVDRKEEAIKASTSALVLDPLSPRLIANHANLLFSAARYIEAAEKSRMALEIDPEIDSAWWTLWFSHAALWDWSRGEAILRDMVEQNPDNPLAYVFLSVSVQTNGRIEEGVILLEKALSLPRATERSWVLFQGGINFIMARDYPRALSLFDAAVERWPMYTGAHIGRSFCYFLQERYDECLEEIAVVEDLQGWEAYVPRLRGRVYAARGEIEKAEEELQKLLEANSLPNQRLCTAYVLAGLGRIDEAIEWFEKAADAHEFHIATIRKLPTAPPELRGHPRFIAFLKRVGLDDNPDKDPHASL